jgi:two-component system, OmpR family, phosphate regulon sensor histidine kinase PhoR
VTEIEESLRSGGILSLVLETIPHGIAVYREGPEITFANKAFYSLTDEHDITELLKTPIEETLLSDRELEFETMLCSGIRKTTLEVRALPIKINQTACVLITLHDVSRIKHLEQMRQDFVANVSHELRTPVTSIRGAAETLLNGALNHPTDANRFTEIVFRQSERLSRIIEDLLSLSRIEQGVGAKEIDFEEHDLASVLSAAIRNCEGRAAQFGVVLRNNSTGSCKSKINATLLEQAVGNLIENAIDHSKQGDTVTVSLSSSTGKACISVKDTGCGIAAEHLPRIFERFYRVDKSRSRRLGGTGLGLAIVKHVILTHRGRIDVQSQPGLGTEFTILLPLTSS